MKDLTKTLTRILIGTVVIHVIITIIEPGLTLKAINIWHTLIGLSYIILYIIVGIWLPIIILTDK